MSAPATPPATPLFEPDPLLHDLLAVSLTAINLLRPCYSPTGELDDFAPEYFNPAAQRMTGLPERPVGTARTLFPDIFTNGIFAFYRQVFETGAPDQLQRYYQADGLDNYFHIAARRSGERLLVSFTDTADQSRTAAENALRASQAAEQAARDEAETQRQRLYDILMQLPAQVAVNRGPLHVFEVVNAPYQQMFPTRRVQGLPLREALPELEGQQFIELLDHVYQTGEPFYGRAMPASVDFTNSGRLEVRYVDVFFQALRTAQGHIDGVLNFSYDVTEQVRARQQVEQLNQELEARVQARTQEAHTARRLAEVQQQRLKQLFLQAPAAICILDGPALVFELVNPAYQQLFSGRALAGLPLLEALPELTGQPVWHTLQQVYRTGQTHLELGIHIPVARTAGGLLEDFYFNYIQQARFDAQGQVDGAVVFAFDVTEQVLARQRVQALNEELAAINEELTATNEELNESNTQLTRTNVDLDTFVYTASHDLKAPITNIESIVLALRDTLPPAVQQDEVVAHLLELLDTTVTRFRFTIGQLTDVSRLQLAHAGPAEPVVLAQVVENVRLDLASSLAAAHTQLTVKVPAELVVSFSPSNLRSIVYNLLSNAIKYRDADRPSQVLVRAEQTEFGIVLTVQDNGLGMSELQQRQLFGLFQRLHTHVEGTGVGLYISKRLVENAGGTITVHSQANAGATFTVTFPA